MTFELREHQKEGLDFLEGKDGAALFYEMGLGKTFILLEHLYRLKSEALPTLIVCPLSAVSVWRREAIKFGYGFTFAELTGSSTKRLKALKEDKDIYVINYDGLRVIGLQLMMKQFKCVIFDESHRLKDRASIQTSKALMLASGIKRRYILTGTPVAKSPEDIWTQFQIIAPGTLGNFYAFRNKYVEFKTEMIRVKGSMRKIMKPIRFRNKADLAERMKTHSLRKTKAECLNLPDKIYNTIECPFTPEQEKHYFGIKRSLATMLNDKQLRVASAAAMIQKMQQICQGFIYDEDKKATFFPSGKLVILKDLLRDIGHEKIILFSWFQADEERLFKDLKGDYRVLRYLGSPTERAEIENEFQESKEPCIFLAQIERAKESITLTAAKHVIYFGNSWNYVSRKQSEDRAHRDGQVNNVNYYDLFVPHTIEELVLHALKTKGALADSLTGDSIRLAQMLIEQQQEVA